MVDKDADGRITEEEIKEAVIVGLRGGCLSIECATKRLLLRAVYFGRGCLSTEYAAKRLLLRVIYSIGGIQHRVYGHEVLAVLGRYVLIALVGMFRVCLAAVLRVFWAAMFQLSFVSVGRMSGVLKRHDRQLTRCQVKGRDCWLYCVVRFCCDFSKYCVICASVSVAYRGVMAHHAKKMGGEVDLFANIRDKMGNMAKVEGQLQASNLVGPIVDTYRPVAAKRPAPSKMKGVGKDRKRLRALAKTGGVGSSGSGNPDLGGFEKSKIQMRKGVEIKLSDTEVGVVEAADPGLVMKALNEYLAWGVVLGMRVTTMLQEELGVRDKKKLAEEIASLKSLRESD
ncbi:EF-Hand 1 [Vigna unguiculata]|uniref:EF-Hand 1 n=1 Tax=Vigna unguiculata TaxID=3917 RepID=A0A4D6MU29_VIGUN|nr:EF-Hand 1 [Vigna unguiculata]